MGTHTHIITACYVFVFSSVQFRGISFVPFVVQPLPSPIFQIYFLIPNHNSALTGQQPHSPSPGPSKHDPAPSSTAFLFWLSQKPHYNICPCVSGLLQLGLCLPVSSSCSIYRNATPCKEWAFCISFWASLLSSVCLRDGAAQEPDPPICFNAWPGGSPSDSCDRQTFPSSSCVFNLP